jgi:hypothetical protein
MKVITESAHAIKPAALADTTKNIACAGSSHAISSPKLSSGGAWIA